MRAHYGRAELVAVAFNVTFQTACNWLDGVTRPTGDKVLLEALRDGAQLLGYAEAHLARAVEKRRAS
ncbi:hypothetical protein O4H61_03395 [Roseovarius aestuarii]|nr:hypothetical protein [Roseovarius aestuarii]